MARFALFSRRLREDATAGHASSLAVARQGVGGDAKRSREKCGIIAVWFKNATAYHVLVDRFAGCARTTIDRAEFAGGTLKGVLERLDYLQWLGIDTVWLTPFYKTSAYHGYHITDFFRVEPRFGALNDVQRLIEGCHQRGMRIVADFVPNHCSYLHSFFMEAQRSQKSPYTDWFLFDHWPDRYRCFLTARELPKLNLDYGPARAHLIDAALYWLSWGFDGLRLDHAIGPSHDFWREFRYQTKRYFPDAILIGEVWLSKVERSFRNTLGLNHSLRRMLFGVDQETLYREYQEVFDGVLDFWLHERFPSITQHEIDAHYRSFPNTFHLAAFLDNHDTDRCLYRAKQDRTTVKKWLQRLLSLPQPVILYYGTETGLTHAASIGSRPFGDNLARQPMVWSETPSEGQVEMRELIRARTTATTPTR